MMIKFPVVGQSSKANGNLTTKFIIAPGSIKRSSFGGSSLVALDGARIIGQSTSVNELGKKLLKAAEDGDVEEVRLLLSKGALFTANWLGVSPLHLAAKNNHLAICEVLLRSGISKDARTKVDRTSLHEAACEGHLRIVNILLEYGADTDCRDMLGMTPLHWAVQWGHTEIVRTLLKHGAQTDFVNKFDLTPEQIAIQINRTDILEILKTGQHPNHLALQLGDDSNESHLHAVDRSPSDSPIPLETVLLEDSDSSPELERISTGQTGESMVQSQDNSFAESMKYLQQRGITLLPDDDHGNILTTVMQTGHSVVLTDVGKEVLNSIKETERTVAPEIKKKTEPISRYITVTPEEFLAMTSNCVAANKSSTNVLRQVNGKLVPKAIKRVVMKKHKVMPITNLNKVFKLSKPAKDSVSSTVSPGTDIKTVMKELVAARKTIEEMKQKLQKKEEEAERYKKQLKLLMDAS